VAACAEADVAACCAAALPVQTMRAAAATDIADRPQRRCGRRIRALRRRPVLTIPALMTVSRFPHPPSRNSPALGAHRAPELRLSIRGRDDIRIVCAPVRRTGNDSKTPRLPMCRFFVAPKWQVGGAAATANGHLRGKPAFFPRFRRSTRCHRPCSSDARQSLVDCRTSAVFSWVIGSSRGSACERCGPAATAGATGGRSRHSRARWRRRPRWG
jgi:hypothetical protein